MELLSRVREALQSRVLAATDRLGIQGDAFALARAGQLPTTHVLSLLDAYKCEISLFSVFFRRIFSLVNNCRHFLSY